MDADLELLLTSVFWTADDLLPVGAEKNAQRRLSDAEVPTLCVAQVIMDLPSDRRFLRAARRQLRGSSRLRARGRPLPRSAKPVIRPVHVHR